MTSRLDVAKAAVHEVRPLLCGADVHSIATAVLAAVDIHDMQVQLAVEAPRRNRNEWTSRRER